MLRITSRPSWLVLASLLVSCLAAVPAAVAAAGDSPPAEVALDAWLLLGPLDTALPAFHHEAPEGEQPTGVDRLLETAHIEYPEVWPAPGDQVTWADGSELVWSPLAGSVSLAPGKTVPRVAYLATYVTAERFVEAELVVTSGHLARVLVDGEPVAEKTGADEGEAGETGRARGEVALSRGKHLVLVKLLRDPDGPAGWEATAHLEVAGERAADLAISVAPHHEIVLSDLLDVDAVTGLELSPDGRFLAVELANPTVPAEHRERWTEIRRTGDGEVVRSLRGSPEVVELAWGPEGRFAYVTRKEEKATLWVGGLEREARAVLAGIEGLGAFRFSPDGKFLVYALTEEAAEDERGVKRLRSLADRWEGYRDKTYLWQVSLADGSRRQLTAGALSTELADLAPDGSRVLFTRTVHTGERPFSVGEVWELELTTPGLAPRKVTEVTWLDRASYGPDGERILIAAGPSAFGETGIELPEGTIPNEYEGELYLVDRDGGAVTPLTREFDPAVLGAAFSRRDGALYLRAADGSSVHLYRHHPGEASFERLHAPVEVVESLELAESGGLLAFTGSSTTRPAAVWTLALTDGAVRLLDDPAATRYERVELGEVEELTFPTEAGGTISGRVHYPVGFDPSGSYPLLVYYYGGVVPTDRSFGGRYPKSWWTANGYVVLVLQPSGATGFGQAFAARHVNDWGQRVAGEIIDGVERFVDTHEFVDRERIGCFGGSYGGFMTMLLTTRTDLFSAAISHAGISSIASYWGEGWWGYLYSAVAGAGSYPWNRPDLYVEQSPLFSAEEITTPLLLLHGTADPNVPPGESEQMYTALEVLGKEVEYVRIAGEAHWILTYPKRKLWWETIIAWFDKHLKGESEYWDHLWKGRG